MPVALSRLIVTQNGLRNVSQLGRMIEYLRRGGGFSNDSLLTYALEKGTAVSPLIHIASVHNRLYVHDGHHRILAMHRAGRTYILNEEYTITHYSYDQYTELGLDRGWLTPFDIVNECRLPDFKTYKVHMRELMGCGLDDHAKAYAVAAASLYKEPRRVTSIEQFTAELSL